jgi:PKD domain
VSFNASASSDPDGSIANYRWDLDGNGSYETNTGTTATASKSYATAQSVTVGLQVTDNAAGTGTTTRTVTINNRAPTASFTATPNPALTGQSVSFDASASSDPDGSIANYKWDLDGNGSYETDTGTTSTASKSYSVVGQVTVRLQVTDNSGATANASRAVTVKYVAKVNFQPAAAPIPAGYIVDSGVAYSAATGMGWIRQDSLTGVHVPLDLTQNTVDRNLDPDQRLDTLIFMQASGSGVTTTPGAWEIAVPNATYTITVTVGDADQINGTQRINAEGQNVINNFVPKTKTKFFTATKSITVTDGRLTIDATNGGSNTKLNYIDIASK